MKSSNQLKRSLNRGAPRKKKANTLGQLLKKLEKMNSQSDRPPEPPDTSEGEAAGKQKSSEPPHTNGKPAASATVARRSSTGVKRVDWRQK